MKMNKKSLSAIIAAVGLFGAVLGTQAAGITDGPKTVTINATIPESMSMSCANPATLTIATVGTPISAQAACTATTNGAAGFNLKAHRVGATNTLLHTDATTPIVDAGTGLTAYTGLPASAAVWTAGTTKGLGFRVQVTGTTNTNTVTDWAADGAATAKYAAFPTADQTIYNYASYSAAASAVTIDYKLDVPATQKSGSYSGTVQYTATTN
jgi:hypothetical protein